MMISQTAEYALRAVVTLAAVHGEALGTPGVAATARVPAGYLAKVLRMLARADLVVSAPGRGGGFRLTREPQDITVLDVVDAVDPIRRIETCPLGLESHGTTLCPLHRRLDETAAQVRQAYGSATIADLLAERGGVSPLCER
jgi:Rrf2 family protein